MATRAKTTSAAAAPTGSFATPIAGSLASTVLYLSGARGPWTYCVSPVALVCRRRRILPAPAKAWHEAGFAQNVRGGRGEGMVSYLATERAYVPVPHERPCVAFGVARNTADPSTYLQRYEGLGPDRKPCVRWCDAWERPTSIGRETRWVHDHDGRDEWLAGLLDLVAPGGLSDTQIRIATEPLIQAARRHLDREAGARRERLLAAQLAHLPREYAPADLLPYYADEAVG